MQVFQFNFETVSKISQVVKFRDIDTTTFCSSVRSGVITLEKWFVFGFLLRHLGIYCTVLSQNGLFSNVMYNHLHLLVILAARNSLGC